VSRNLNPCRQKHRRQASGQTKCCPTSLDKDFWSGCWPSQAKGFLTSEIGWRGSTRTKKALFWVEPTAVFQGTADTSSGIDLIATRHKMARYSSTTSMESLNYINAGCQIDHDVSGRKSTDPRCFDVGTRGLAKDEQNLKGTFNPAILLRRNHCCVG
jgi:hypothetical protein